MSNFLKFTGFIFLIIAFFGACSSSYITHQTFFALIALIGFVNLGFSKLIDIFENKQNFKNNKNKKKGVISFFLGEINL